MIKIKIGKFMCVFNLYLTLRAHAYDQYLKDMNTFVYIKSGDPQIHIENQTYGRLTFLRGHVIGEQNLNKNGDCSGTCFDYNRTEYYHHHSNSSLKSTGRCHGKVYRCLEIRHFSTFLTVRIDGHVYELTLNKVTNEMEFHKFDDHIAYVNWAAKNKFAIHDILHDSKNCQMCKCYCDDIYNPLSVRSFCQDMIESDIFLGYVITGIRFKIIQRIVTLEIQQGRLVRGEIDARTVHWKKSSPCSYYGNLSYDHRSIQLDDIYLNENQVITGISWIRYDHQTQIYGTTTGRLSLFIKTVDIDQYGYVLPHNWMVYQKSKEPRKHLEISHVDISTESSIKSKETSIPNKHYIKFRASDWSKDFAQHVVPFIDLQEVVTDPPQPIAGIGVYHRTSAGYGGFIALKLIVKNYPKFSIQMMRKNAPTFTY